MSTAMNKLPMTIAGAACGAVSLILGVAAIVVPNWLALDLGLAKANYGLWRACLPDTTGQVICVSYVDAPGWIKATSALEVTGICVTFLAVLLALLHISVAKNSKAAGKTPGPCAIAGGLFMIVGAIVWAVKYKDNAVLAAFNLSEGFILAILSAVLSIIAGILLFLGWRAASSENSYTTF